MHFSVSDALMHFSVSDALMHFSVSDAQKHYSVTRGQNVKPRNGYKYHVYPKSMLAACMVEPE